MLTHWFNVALNDIDNHISRLKSQTAVPMSPFIFGYPSPILLEVLSKLLPVLSSLKLIYHVRPPARRPFRAVSSFLYWQ